MKLIHLVILAVSVSRLSATATGSRIFAVLSPAEQQRLNQFSQQMVQKHSGINLDLITTMQLTKQFVHPVQHVEDSDLKHPNIVKLNEASLVQKGNSLVFMDEYSPVLQKEEVLCAQARYKDQLKSTGWDQLYVKTSESCDLGLAIWGAGFLEGFMTSYKIQYFYSNLVRQHEEDNKEYIEQVFKFYKDVEQNIRQRTKYVYSQNDVNIPPEDQNTCLEKTYLQQIGLLQLQADGMLVGYNQNHPVQLTMSDLFFVNGDGQIQELIQLFKDNWMKKSRPNQFRLKTMMAGSKLNIKRLLKKSKVNTIQELFDLRLPRGHCSVLFKAVKKDGKLKDLLLSHQTWDDYSQMLRIFKHYEIGGHEMTFSSYPGCISSTDDWYNNKSKEGQLVVTETTLEVLNDQLYNYLISYDKYLPDFMRIVLSNRLAYDGKTWTFWMEYYNTGTYNSQWLIVDVKKAKESQGQSSLAENTFVMFEQMPGDQNIKMEDMSAHLWDKGFYASYNIPYFPEIRKVSGYEDIVEAQEQGQGGDNYSYSSNPRAVIFQNYQQKVTDLASMKSIMQMNLYQSNEFKRLMKSNKEVFGDKLMYSNNPGHQIAARFDLVRGMSRNVGAIDVKVVDIKMASKGSQWTISGPSYQEQPVFQWSSAKSYDQHLGQPDEWKFEWMVIEPSKMASE